MQKRQFFLTVIFLFCACRAVVLGQAGQFSQKEQTVYVDFYAIQTNSSDKNQITMTQDLYYSHLSSLDNIIVNDKRDQKFLMPDFVDLLANKAEATVDRLSSRKVAFYAEIKENVSGLGTWTCTLHGVNLYSGLHIKKEDTYSSFYKVLLDAKTYASKVVYQAAGLAPPPQQEQQEPTVAISPPLLQPDTPPVVAKKQSPESLSGTWSGEEFIDKIVILRGGRGFVIYKNGASMNITVSISAQDVDVVQVGKSNASFFPDLPRDVALQIATSAPAIKWTLTLVDDNTLKGKKTTLAMQNGQAVETQVEVLWQRQ